MNSGTGNADVAQRVEEKNRGARRIWELSTDLLLVADLATSSGVRSIYGLDQNGSALSEAGTLLLEPEFRMAAAS